MIIDLVFPGQISQSKYYQYNGYYHHDFLNLKTGKIKILSRKQDDLGRLHKNAENNLG